MADHEAEEPRRHTPRPLARKLGRFLLGLIPTFESGEWVSVGHLCEEARKAEMITDAEAADQFRRRAEWQGTDQAIPLVDRIQKGRRYLVEQKLGYYREAGIVERDGGRDAGANRRYRKTEQAPRIVAEQAQRRKHRPQNQPGHHPRRGVVRVPVDRLTPHPRNTMLYGDDVDQDLIDSIREFGVLEPLHITTRNQILSGHRRWRVAKSLGLGEVPCIVEKQVDPTDERAVARRIVHHNRQRVKTLKQRNAEAACLLEIEARQARERCAEAGKRGGRGRKGVEPVSHPIEGKARDRVGAALGVSGPTAEGMAAIHLATEQLEAEGRHQEAEAILRVQAGKGPGMGVKPAARRAKQVLKASPDSSREKPSQPPGGPTIPAIEPAQPSPPTALEELRKAWAKATPEERRQFLSEIEPVA